MTPHLRDSAVLGRTGLCVGRLGVIAYTTTRWGTLLKANRMPPGQRPLSAAECYRFVLTNPHVDLCLTGPANERQLNEALRALDAGPLSPEEMDRLRRIGDHVHEAATSSPRSRLRQFLRHGR